MKSEPKGHFYKRRKYTIVPADSAWSREFAQYASKIRKIFGDIEIEHVGSTSVPGMSGKPCIDVLVIPQDLEMVAEHVSDMEQAGFIYAGQIVGENSRLFRVASDGEVLCNVHFFPVGHPHIKEFLDVRDYLRSHPQEVLGYSSIKKELQAKYPTDYASYRKYKDEYVRNLQSRATEWAANLR